MTSRRFLLTDSLPTFSVRACAAHHQMASSFRGSPLDGDKLSWFTARWRETRASFSTVSPNLIPHRKSSFMAICVSLLCSLSICPRWIYSVCASVELSQLASSTSIFLSSASKEKWKWKPLRYLSPYQMEYSCSLPTERNRMQPWLLHTQVESLRRVHGL